MSKNLGMAYNVQRKASNMKKGQVGCMDCMASGGKCMAHGGEVENRKLHPDAMDMRPEDMRHDQMLEEDEGDNESGDAKLSRGGLIEEIMQDRKRRKMASGGLVDAPSENDFETRMDFEPVHTREDEEHDTESPSKDDDSLVGQILKERKMRRRD